jgi:hypothetical protein
MKSLLRTRRSFAPCIVIAATSVRVACRSDETNARDQFASRFTCPAERITVTLRKDLTAVDLEYRTEAPPSEVAADPRRLELWKKEQARTAAEYDGMSVVQARGCDHELFFVCGQLRVGVGTTRYGCRDASYPPRG